MPQPTSIGGACTPPAMLNTATRVGDDARTANTLVDVTVTLLPDIAAGTSHSGEPDLDDSM